MPHRKCCIVPKCKNTSISTPNKLFLCVPKDSKIRKKWCKVMKRNDKTPLSSKSGLYCCEDHFDLETDLENYLKYKMVGGPLKLKKEVAPHKFACQKTEERNPPERPGYKKLQQIEFYKRVLSPDICHENLIPQEELVLLPCEEIDSNNTTVIDPLRIDDMSDTHGCLNRKSVAVQVNIKPKVKYRSKATNTDANYFEIPKLKPLKVKYRSKATNTDADYFKIPKLKPNKLKDKPFLDESFARTKESGV